MGYPSWGFHGAPLNGLRGQVFSYESGLRLIGEAWREFHSLLDWLIILLSVVASLIKDSARTA